MITRPVLATDKHQAFYELLVGQARDGGLMDVEMVAILGRLLGYAIASAGKGDDAQKLFVDTLNLNILKAREDFLAGLVQDKPGN